VVQVKQFVLFEGGEGEASTEGRTIGISYIYIYIYIYMLCIGIKYAVSKCNARYIILVVRAREIKRDA